MKKGRQEKLIELIQVKDIGTQDELMEELKNSGYIVTQATVSRDIRELKLVKKISKSGKNCYALPNSNISESALRLHSLLSTSHADIDFAGNLVVIKTDAGMAQAICAAIDSAGYDEIVGSIAGDDTIFLAARTPENAVSMASSLKRIQYSN